MTERPREEHLAWCKQRALEYLDNGEVESAIASMLSDLRKHPAFGVNPAIEQLGLWHAIKGDEREARRFIEGFR